MVIQINRKRKTVKNDVTIDKPRIRNRLRREMDKNNRKKEKLVYEKKKT